MKETAEDIRGDGLLAAFHSGANEADNANALERPNQPTPVCKNAAPAEPVKSTPIHLLPWKLYRLTLKEPNHYYVGISSQVERRIQNHLTGWDPQYGASGSKIARYFGIESYEIVKTLGNLRLAMSAENIEVRRLRAEGKIAYGGKYTPFNKIPRARQLGPCICICCVMARKAEQ